MKNYITFSILFLSLLFASCVKESDTLTDVETEVIPQEGDTRLITGIIKDTSGATIQRASVKFVINDLELETEADENGVWDLTVPVSTSDGYLVANKIDYSKSIHRFTASHGDSVDDIYLARDPSNTEIDLSINQNSLKTVIGRIVDAQGNPIPNVALFLISTIDGVPVDYVFHGVVHTLSLIHI